MKTVAHSDPKRDWLQLVFKYGVKSKMKGSYAKARGAEKNAILLRVRLYTSPSFGLAVPQSLTKSIWED